MKILKRLTCSLISSLIVISMVLSSGISVSATTVKEYNGGGSGSIPGSVSIGSGGGAYWHTNPGTNSVAAYKMTVYIDTDEDDADTLDSVNVSELRQSKWKEVSLVIPLKRMDNWARTMTMYDYAIQNGYKMVGNSAIDYANNDYTSGWYETWRYPKYMNWYNISESNLFDKFHDSYTTTEFAARESEIGCYAKDNTNKIGYVPTEHATYNNVHAEWLDAPMVVIVEPMYMSASGGRNKLLLTPADAQHMPGVDSRFKENLSGLAVTGITSNSKYSAPAGDKVTTPAVGNCLTGIYTYTMYKTLESDTAWEARPIVEVNTFNSNAQNAGVTELSNASLLQDNPILKNSFQVSIDSKTWNEISNTIYSAKGVYGYSFKYKSSSAYKAYESLSSEDKEHLKEALEPDGSYDTDFIKSYNKFIKSIASKYSNYNITLGLQNNSSNNAVQFDVGNGSYNKVNIGKKGTDYMYSLDGLKPISNSGLVSLSKKVDNVISIKALYGNNWVSRDRDRNKGTRNNIFNAYKTNPLEIKGQMSQDTYDNLKGQYAEKSTAGNKIDISMSDLLLNAGPTRLNIYYELEKPGATIISLDTRYDDTKGKDPVNEINLETSHIMEIQTAQASKLVDGYNIGNPSNYNTNIQSMLKQNNEKFLGYKVMDSTQADTIMASLSQNSISNQVEMLLENSSNGKGSTIDFKSDYEKMIKSKGDFNNSTRQYNSIIVVALFGKEDGMAQTSSKTVTKTTDDNNTVKENVMIESLESKFDSKQSTEAYYKVIGPQVISPTDKYSYMWPKKDSDFQEITYGEGDNKLLADRFDLSVATWTPTWKSKNVTASFNKEILDDTLYTFDMSANNQVALSVCDQYTVLHKDDQYKFFKFKDYGNLLNTYKGTVDKPFGDFMGKPITVQYLSARNKDSSPILAQYLDKHNSEYKKFMDSAVGKDKGYIEGTAPAVGHNTVTTNYQKDWTFKIGTGLQQSWAKFLEDIKGVGSWVANSAVETYNTVFSVSDYQKIKNNTDKTAELKSKDNTTGTAVNIAAPIMNFTNGTLFEGSYVGGNNVGIFNSATATQGLGSKGEFINDLFQSQSYDFYPFATELWTGQIGLKANKSGKSVYTLGEKQRTFKDNDAICYSLSNTTNVQAPWSRDYTDIQRQTKMGGTPTTKAGASIKFDSSATLNVKGYVALQDLAWAPNASVANQKNVQALASMEAKVRNSAKSLESAQLSGYSNLYDGFDAQGFCKSDGYYVPAKSKNSNSCNLNITNRNSKASGVSVKYYGVGMNITASDGRTFNGQPLSPISSDADIVTGASNALSTVLEKGTGSHAWYQEGYEGIIIAEVSDNVTMNINSSYFTIFEDTSDKTDTDLTTVNCQTFKTKLGNSPFTVNGQNCFGIGMAAKFKDSAGKTQVLFGNPYKFFVRGNIKDTVN